MKINIIRGPHTNENIKKVYAFLVKQYKLEVLNKENEKETHHEK